MSPTGTPVTFAEGNTETVADAGTVGRAILLEKTCDDVEVSVAVEDAVDFGDFGDFGESGDASDPVDVGRMEVTTVVLV